MNMKLDSLVVTTGMVWLAVLLVAVLTGVSAKPLDEAAGFHSSRNPSSSQRDWFRVRSARTVPDFISGALEQLQHRREKRFPRVPMGTKCSADSNCPADHCCAMKLGNAVCMPLLSRGRTCMVNGPSAYTPNLLFTQCPCNSLQELSCARRGSGNRGVCS